MEQSYRNRKGTTIMSPGWSVASLLTCFRFVQCEGVHRNITDIRQRYSPLILCDVERNEPEQKALRSG